MKIFEDNGGHIIRKKISNFQDLSMFDLIVNCTGIGAKKLAKDESVHPIRGQVSRVSC